MRKIGKIHHFLWGKSPFFMGKITIFNGKITIFHMDWMVIYPLVMADIASY